jgi:hypothetical protein
MLELWKCCVDRMRQPALDVDFATLNISTDLPPYPAAVPDLASSRQHCSLLLPSSNVSLFANILNLSMTTRGVMRRISLEGPDVLANGRECSLTGIERGKLLFPEGEGILKDAARSVLEVFEGGHWFNTIFIYDGQLGDDGLMALLEGLGRSRRRRLGSIVLSGCGITDYGVQSLLHHLADGAMYVGSLDLSDDRITE